MKNRNAARAVKQQTIDDAIVLIQEMVLPEMNATQKAMNAGMAAAIAALEVWRETA